MLVLGMQSFLWLYIPFQHYSATSSEIWQDRWSSRGLQRLVPSVLFSGQHALLIHSRCFSVYSHHIALKHPRIFPEEYIRSVVLRNLKQMLTTTDMFVLGTNGTFTDARWTVTDVNAGTPFFIDLYRRLHVARWQLLSQLVIKSRVYHRIQLSHWSTHSLAYWYLPHFTITSGLLGVIFHGHLVVELDFISFIWLSFFTDLVGYYHQSWQRFWTGPPPAQGCQAQSPPFIPLGHLTLSLSRGCSEEHSSWKFHSVHRCWMSRFQRDRNCGPVLEVKASSALQRLPPIFRYVTSLLM